MKFPASGTVLLAISEVLSAIKRLIPDKSALRRGDLQTLRQIVSLFVFMMVLLIRLVIARRERAVARALASILWAERNLRHPPQTWAAP